MEDPMSAATTKAPLPKSPYLTVEQAAAYLGMSRHFLQRLR